MAGNDNKSLRSAKEAKKDEFYTQSSDIQEELKHYRKHFKGKVVFCNCDDPFESNFFKYFALNFERLGLKQLISTCYDGSPIAGTQLALPWATDAEVKSGKVAYKAVVNAVYDADKDGDIDMYDVQKLFEMGENTLEKLDGNGDFRSAECIELLKQSDIVVTNPPFSLFREYVAQLMEFDKNFIIIGNKNAITYKEIFPLLKNNQMWIGCRNINSDMWFIVPNGENYEKVENGIKTKHIMGCWFTNLDVKKRHSPMLLYKRYNPEEYPEYDNYKAIEVSKVAEIPEDYNGVMGVPITFLDKYCPEQFEIVGFFNNYKPETADIKAGQIYGEAVPVSSTKSLFRGPVINGKAKYFRVIIKKIAEV